MEKEMKYIVIELQKNAEGHISPIVTEHNTLAEAESKFYSIMAYAAVGEIPMHSATILREDGFPVMYKHYTHKVVEPEEEQTAQND